MAFSAGDLIDRARRSRENFLKHIEGLRDDQWNWKPYPECKSISETLGHLVGVDRAFLFSLETGKSPDYEALMEPAQDKERLLEKLAESHKNLVTFLDGRFRNVALETPVPFFGEQTPLGIALADLTSEDSYHSGQVAYIRMATDPQWDYYAAIYS